MGRRAKGEPPAYRRHRRPDGRVLAYVSIGGKRRYLGEYGSPQSYARHREWVARWEADQPAARPYRPRGVVTVTALCAAYLDYARRQLSEGEADHFDHLIRTYLVPAYGELEADRFRPGQLKEVRQKMIDAGYARTSINQRIGKVRRLFRWGVGEEMVEPSVVAGLEAVADLKPGRSPARETEPVSEVPEAVVLATVPHLPSRQLQAVVRLLLLTGMHPGEAVAMRGIDVHREAVKVGRRTISLPAGVWAYVPAQHKGKHRGKPQVYLLGPRAQELLTPWLRSDPVEYLFSPREARAERHAAMRALRKSNVQPSQQNRAKRHPKRQPGPCYRVDSLSHAVGAAAEKAGVPRWNPAQIRHTVATRIDAGYGLEASSHVLGHLSMDTTLIYTERNLALAAKVMGEIG